MAGGQRRHDEARVPDRDVTERAPPRRGRAERSAGAPQEVPGQPDAGEEPAAVRRRVEGDRRHAQAGQGARGRRSQGHGRRRVAAETARRAPRRQRLPQIALGLAARRLAVVARPSAAGGRASPRARRRHRGPTPAAREERLLSHLQPAPENRRGAWGERRVQRLPHPRAPAGLAAAQARRAGALRGLPPHSLRGDAPILKVTAFVDGASRGNPGPAGFGVYMKTDRETIELCGYLGVTTNNVAEYAGLLEELTIAKQEGATEIDVISDSLLLVNQMLGKYRVKHPNLIPLYNRAVRLAREFRRFSIRHTLRAGNKDADRLANLAVDRADGRWVERRRIDSSEHRRRERAHRGRVRPL